MRKDKFFQYGTSFFYTQLDVSKREGIDLFRYFLHGVKKMSDHPGKKHLSHRLVMRPLSIINY